MKQRISHIFTALAILLATSLPLFASNIAQAASTGAAKNEICSGLGVSGGSCSSSNASSLNHTVSSAVTVLSIIAGIAAIIMIIVSGISFTTSGGDSNKVASAKSSLLYAVIGLIVTALAQFIVHFVIGRT